MKRSRAHTGSGTQAESADEPSSQAQTSGGSPDLLNSSPAATTRSSGRKRNVPARFDKENHGDKLHSSPKRAAVGKSSGRGRTNKSIDRFRDPKLLLQHPNSPLVYCNLIQLLQQPMAWDSLSRQQQEHLLSFLPRGTEAIPSSLNADAKLPNIAVDILRSNESFQADVRFFQEDLSAGRYDPQWIADAVEAGRKRKEGVFDSWKEKEREAFWGQTQKSDWHSLAGESAELSFAEMIAQEIFQVGDTWMFRRGWGRGEHTIVVEKEAKVMKVDKTTKTLDFSYPPVQDKIFKGDSVDNKALHNVDGPSTLSAAILKEDGRIPNDVRAANAWREFRCIRRNQDMGSLWEVREIEYNRRK